MIPTIVLHHQFAALDKHWRRLRYRFYIHGGFSSDQALCEYDLFNLIDELRFRNTLELQRRGVLDRVFDTADERMAAFAQIDKEMNDV
jgi:hypothetical protein